MIYKINCLNFNSLKISDYYKKNIFLNSGIATSEPSTLTPGPTPASNWYARPEMIPFLSLCSRYPGPWAGLLQQSMKEKQKMVSRKILLSFNFSKRVSKITL
jgi:hypothetical protein